MLMKTWSRAAASWILLAGATLVCFGVIAFSVMIFQRQLAESSDVFSLGESVRATTDSAAKIRENSRSVLDVARNDLAGIRERAETLTNSVYGACSVSNLESRLARARSRIIDLEKGADEVFPKGISYHTNAPIPGPSDAASFPDAAWDRDNLGGDGAKDGLENDLATFVSVAAPHQGQTFLTASNPFGYRLKAVWLKHAGYTRNEGTTEWAMVNGSAATVRVTDPAAAGSPAFALISETMTITGAEHGTPNVFAPTTTRASSTNGTGVWVRFGLSAPILLKPSRAYGFDVTSRSPGLFFETLGLRSAAGGNLYTNGTAYIGGARGRPDAAMNLIDGDRAFLVELEAIPAPVLLPPTARYAEYRPIRTLLRLESADVLGYTFTAEYSGVLPSERFPARRRSEVFLGHQVMAATGRSVPGAILDVPDGLDTAGRQKHRQERQPDFWIYEVAVRDVRTRAFEELVVPRSEVDRVSAAKSRFPLKEQLEFLIPAGVVSLSNQTSGSGEVTVPVKEASVFTHKGEPYKVVDLTARKIVVEKLPTQPGDASLLREEWPLGQERR